jgi:hypothetical protein
MSKIPTRFRSEPAVWAAATSTRFIKSSLRCALTSVNNLVDFMMR